MAVKVIEIIRIPPHGYKLEDIRRYREQVLKSVTNAVGEWICWPTGSFYPPRQNIFSSDEILNLQSKQIDCIYVSNLPLYWRKEWIKKCLEDWQGKLPAARFLPLDLAPSYERSYFLPTTTSSSTFKSLRNSLSNDQIQTTLTGFCEQDLAYVFPILSETKNNYKIPKNLESHPNLNENSSSPTVSILMSTYNMKDTIGWSIRSALTQTYQNWELLIGDDASNDDSLLEMLTFSDTRIKIFQEPRNIGKARMMNKLLQQAAGEFILELDGDDWIPPTAIEHMVEILKQSPTAGMASGSYGCWTRSYQMGCSWKGVVIPNDTDGIQWLNQGHPPIPRMYRKTALEDIGGWLDHAEDWNRVFEDIEVTTRLLKRYAVAYSSEVLYHRVIHPNSVSQRNRDWFPSWIQIIKNRR